MAATIETIETLEQATGKYKYGFVTDIESEKAPKGLNEDIIRFISAKKDEPECFFFQAEDGIRDLRMSRGLGDVYKRQL